MSSFAQILHIEKIPRNRGVNNIFHTICTICAKLEGYKRRTVHFPDNRL